MIALVVAEAKAPIMTLSSMPPESGNFVLAVGIDSHFVNTASNAANCSDLYIVEPMNGGTTPL